jgi:hypothetical protein
MVTKHAILAQLCHWDILPAQLHLSIEWNWASIDFGVHRGSWNQAPKDARDNCIYISPLQCTHYSCNTNILFCSSSLRTQMIPGLKFWGTFFSQPLRVAKHTSIISIAQKFKAVKKLARELARRWHSQAFQSAGFWCLYGSPQPLHTFHPSGLSLSSVPAPKQPRT